MRLSRIICVMCAVTLPLLTGCAQTPNIKAPQPGIGPCDKLTILQSGREIQPDNGEFHLNRESFVVRYRGNEQAPALSVSQYDLLVKALQGHGRKQLWASAGDYMASAPNNLTVREDFMFYTNEKSRNSFAANIGANYPSFLDGLVATNPELDIATYIPKAAGGFVQEGTGNSYIFNVKTINGLAISQTRLNELYIAYFGTIEKLGPPPKGIYESQSLIKMNWGACHVKFNDQQNADQSGGALPAVKLNNIAPGIKSTLPVKNAPRAASYEPVNCTNAPTGAVLKLSPPAASYALIFCSPGGQTVAPVDGFLWLPVDKPPLPFIFHAATKNSAGGIKSAYFTQQAARSLKGEAL